MSLSTFTAPRRSAGTTPHPTRRAHAVAARSAGFTGTSAARRAGLAAVAGLVTVGVAAPAAHAEAFSPAASSSNVTSTEQASTTSSAGTSSTSDSTADTRYTTVDLNVRTGATTSSERVTTLDPGTEVTPTGASTEGWTQIRHHGHKRWVATRYLSKDHHRSDHNSDHASARSAHTSAASATSATYTSAAVSTRAVSTSRSVSRPALATVNTSSLSAKRAAIVKAAYQGIGSSYVYGGTKFGAWDCSGFVLWATGHAGVSLPRTAAAQAAALTRTSTPQPGDLVLQNGGGHIGIYVGNGMMISALNPSEGTKLHPVSWMPVAGYYTYNS